MPAMNLPDMLTPRLLLRSTLECKRLLFRRSPLCLPL